MKKDVGNNAVWIREENVIIVMLSSDGGIPHNGE